MQLICETIIYVDKVLTQPVLEAHVDSNNR